MRTVVLDFDGTIADTFPVVLDIFHKVSRREHPLTTDEAKLLKKVALLQVRGRAIIRHARELHISLWRIPFLFYVCRLILKGRMQDVAPMSGMDDVIRTLHDDGVRVVVMSSNTTHNIDVFLRKEGLDKYVSAIYGSVRSSRKSKVMTSLIKRRLLHADTDWCVGDEGRDIRAGNTAGLRTIAVSWGYNDLEQLEDAQPTAIVNDATSLLQQLKEEPHA